MPAAITIEGLEWCYEGSEKFALQGVTLEVPAGSFLGIVGANQQGKTTLVSAMSGLIPNCYNGIFRGSVQLFGRDITAMTPREIATHVGIVFSDPEAQFTSTTVEEELAFGLENIGIGLGEIEKRIRWAAKLTKIDELIDRSPYSISGGQKQRVAIASVLAMKPPIIIMDEPMSMIDPSGKSELLEILQEIQRNGDHTLIVVEHDLDELIPMVDNLLLMNQGAIAKMATPQEFFYDLASSSVNDVSVPDVIAFGRWLRTSHFLSEDSPIPLDLPAAVKAAEAVTKSRRAGK